MNPRVQVSAVTYRKDQGADTQENHPVNGESTVTTIAKSAIAARRGVTAMEYGLIAGLLAVWIGSILARLLNS